MRDDACHFPLGYLVHLACQPFPFSEARVTQSDTLPEKISLSNEEANRKIHYVFDDQKTFTDTVF